MTAPITDPDPLDPTPTPPVIPPRMQALLALRAAGTGPAGGALGELAEMAAQSLQFARWAAKGVVQASTYLPKIKAALVGLDTARKAHAVRLTTLESRVSALEAKTP